MAGDIKLKYPAASTAVTVTNLHSLASSSTYISGWFSGSVNNTSNVYMDYLWGGTFTSHASNRQSGSLYVYAVAALNDTPTWPATATGTLGTEGTGSFSDAYKRDSLCRLLAVINTDNTASAIYTFPPTSIRNLWGEIPPYHCLYITGNLSTTTTAQLASSGSALYYTPITYQYT
jgi:hypothetical protein